jgi:probable F420-dependent oxidoreductase
LEVYAAIEDPRLPLGDVAAYARRAERCGFTGLLIPESIHDAFMTSLLALEHTVTLRVVTSVALAFPRSPMIVAYAAWDLQKLSNGRFGLGLGSQVKGNIEGRFSTEWTAPVPRMRDYIGSLRAIWEAWQSGAKLDYRSESYSFTKMQPFFAPDPLECGAPQILLGGVNRNMTRLAGETADGFMTHPTNTNPPYLREAILPNLQHGAARSHRDRNALECIGSTFVAAGRDRAAVAREREGLREYLGFVFSTPQYWPTLDLLDHGEVGKTLLEHTRAGRWEEMKAAIPDDLLDVLVPSGTYEEIVPTLLDWYDDLLDAITLRMPADPAHDRDFVRVVETLRASR